MGRVRYGVKNLHYAVATDNGAGVLTYGTPVALPGAKSLGLDAQGDATDEYADDIVWFHDDANTGYSGNLAFEDTAQADEFLAAVLGTTEDSNGVVFESSSDIHKEFALMGQFTLAGGTETGKRFCLFRCTASRPSVSGETKEAGVAVATNEITITAMPRISDDMVKASCVSTSSAYADWFNAVPTKATTAGE